MEPAQHINMREAIFRKASPHSHSPSSSGSSTESVSSPISTSTAHELLNTQYNNAVQQNTMNHAPELTHKSHRAEQAMRQNQQIVQKRGSCITNIDLKLREAPGQVACSRGSIHRFSGSNAENLKWRSWDEVHIRVSGLPHGTLTRDLAAAFSGEGTIRSIEIFENQEGMRSGNANLIFRPPPAKPFWNNGIWSLRRMDQQVGTCQLRLGNPPRIFMHRSLTRGDVSYPETMTMKAEALDFGIMIDENKIMGMKRVTANVKTAITFQQNLFHRELITEFRLPIQDWRSNKSVAAIPNLGRLNREEDFKFKIPFRDLTRVCEVPLGPECFALFITLEVPPRFFKRVENPQFHDDHSKVWKDKDSWYRQTDVVYNPSGLKRLPLTLKKTHALLDLGRWITYRFTFNMSNNDKKVHQQIRSALCDHGVSIVPSHDLELIACGRSTIWEYIDKNHLHRKNTGSALQELSQDDVPPLTFRVRYQLEVCLSHGYFNEYSLGQEFIQKLADMQPGAAQDLLEFVASQRKPVFHPMSVYDLKPVSGTTSSAKIPDYCVLVRSLTVTPTTIYFHTPTIETSNRVIRQYSEHSDRFLRVRFTDEESGGKIFPTTSDTMNEVFTRIKRTLSNGIQIGDRHYEFLAFGNSQFREHGAFFFAPTSHIDAKRIRMWMGSFQEIKSVSKYASRVGQCFSTTRAITSVMPDIKELADIFHNGFRFTDGVGRISPFLAQLAASELGILKAGQETPSVFQFRLGGCKGVLAVSPTSTARELHLRMSQYKFPASHEGLDIIQWSQFACAKLNQQLILVLSTLGVPDDVFKDKMQIQLNDLKQAMTDSKKALSLLQKYVDHNQMTLTLASMIIDGFQTSEEPFMLALLQLWRAWSTKYLKEKAQIAMSEGALLLGCVDETDTLRGHYNETHRSMPGPEASMEERSRYLPQIFVQLSRDPANRGNPKPKVILGPMLLARNPSLHPGDIRIVCGTDVPELHHLKDVVVLPQNGDRDLASMCSGGDLDGDDFLVIWDHKLLPEEWNLEPMDYSAPPPLCHEGEITVDDLTTFFVTYMRTNSLGPIAVAHRTWADFLDDGVKAEKCLKLAQLHSKAVDFPKTGQPVHMTQDLQPRKWPHFMERKNTKKDQIYISRKILGQLYDQVERTDFFPDYSRPFSRQILEAYDLPGAMLATARRLKKEYDAALCHIMARLEIKTEFEVWSTFALSHNRSNDFKFHEEIGQLSTNLKTQYRDLCVKAAGGKQHDQLGPFVAAMYQITEEEMALAVQQRSQIHTVNGQPMPLRQMTPGSMPLMSFPWIFHDVLGKIANPCTFPSCTKVQAEAITSLEVTQNGPRKGRSLANTAVVLPDLETAQGVIHQGDLFRPFASQHLKDLEEYGEEDVPQSPLESASQTAASDERHSMPDPITPTAGSSPASNNGEFGILERHVGHGNDNPVPSNEIEHPVPFSEKASTLNLSVLEVGLSKHSRKEHMSSIENLHEVLADDIHVLQKGEPLKNIESGGQLVNSDVDIQSDAEPEEAEEVNVQPIWEKRSLNKLLEAYSFREDEQEDEEEI